MKSFGLDQQFQKVKESTKAALNSIFPIEGKTRVLKLEDIVLEDTLEDDDYSGQAKVKSKNGTWGVPVYAKLALYEKGTNKLLDKAEKIRLFTLPKITNRYSYIVGGNEYQVTNQLRLKPGAYTIRKQNGELKTMINLGVGKNFDLMFNEKNAQFTIDKVGGGQARIPLYPILTSLGISSGDVERSWGTQIAMANKSSDERAVTRAKTSFGIRKGTLQEYFNNTKISPETTKITLGQGFDRVSGPMLLKAAKKLLDVHFGRQESDDRDAMQFKEIHGVEDFIKERLEKNKAALAFRIKRTIDSPKREKISQLVNPGAFNNMVSSFFTQDDRSATPEQTNPLEMLSGQYKATIMGPGGIKSDHAVTDDMRELHPSHYGFVDPVHTPESKRIGANLHLPLGFKKDGNEIKKIVLDKNGKPVELTPAEAFHKKIAFPGQVGPNYKVNFRGKTMEVPKSDVDYFTPKAEALFSWSTNLIPYLPADQGNRSMMAAKQLEQAISLKHREAPLVQVDAANGKTMEDVIGDNIAIKSPVDGVVKEVTQDQVVIKSAHGDVKLGLYNHFALNRKSFLHHQPTVKKGDQVKKGQVIADSNFTKDGVLALGTNMKTAYIPYKGYNFEDGIVITESASEKLTSEHIHKKSLDSDENTVLKLSAFRTQYPNAATAENLSKLDDTGVIKKGARVKQGDIVIAALQKRVLPKTVTIIEKKLSDRPKDASVTWNYEDDGIVTDVIRSGNSITVNIKTEERAKIGDKLCYDRETEFLTKDGWKNVSDVSMDDYICTLVPNTDIVEYRKPNSLISFNYYGKMYSLKTQMLDIMVTPDHSLYVKPIARGAYDLIAAVSCLGRRLEHKKNGIWAEGKRPVINIDGYNIDPVAWFELLGWFISEGSISVNKKKNYEISIAQVKKHTREKLRETLQKLPWKHYAQSDRYKFYSKEVLTYLSSMGKKCYLKELPREVFNADKECLRALLRTATLGDGTMDNTMWHYFTTSKKLADQIQEIAMLVGYSADVFTRKTPPNGLIKGKRYNFKTCYAVHIRKKKHTPCVNHSHTKDQKIQTEGFVDYAGKVYCVNIDNHVVMTRRNGRTVWSGNCGRHGNKGIITKIIPDSEAPKDKDGNPMDILLNPHGVISRINMGQMYESAAAKAAAKAGKPHVVKNFSGEDYLDSTKSFMDKSGMSDKEELFDANGKSLGKVHVGNPYILKLFKLSQGNFSVRQGGPGHSYDQNMQPLKAGGEEAAKNLDVLTMYSMLSHGARANLRDMASLKSNQNDEFWKALKSGQPLPPPKTPFVFDKFTNYLKAAGIDIKKEGSKLVLAPMIDEELEKISAGEVKKPMFFRAKNLEPIKGGFMDPVKFGGFKGTKWGHIELKEPVVNPVFEKAVRKITDLGTKFDSIMDGKLHYHNGQFNSDGKGATGGAAIQQILKNIDVDEQIKVLQAKAKTAKASSLDDINKKLRYFMALKKYDLTPDKAYIRSKVAVIPPTYRPIYALPDGSVTTSDVNLIYQNLGVLNTIQKLPVMDMLPDEEKALIRKDVYTHVKGLSGLTDIPIKGKERAGFISEIAGTQPKEGFFISKMLSKKQDYVGRATIIPEPSLGVDEVGMPETMAWKMFEPFVTRELVTKFGKTPIQAVDEIKKKTPLARKALEIIMNGRKVLLNRAPSLHKFSIMAFKPKITNGTALKIPPLVVKGFNADFDGDTMMVHAPITDEANREAEKMMPSRNLYQPGTGKLMIMPAQEAQIGLFYLSKTPKGRKIINDIVGVKYAISDVLNKKTTEALLSKISKEVSAQEFGRIIASLKSEGEKHSYDRGFTLGLDDLVTIKKERDMLVKAVQQDVKNAKQEDLLSLSNKANKMIDSILEKKLKGTDNPLFDMIESGAKGSPSQLRGILATPLFVSDSKGNVVPSAIKKSYSEGLDVPDYWTSLYGARRGMMDRAIQTSLPGAFSKDIMANTLDNVISAVDCGTKKGVKISVENKDAMNRYLAGDQGPFPHNLLVDTTVIKKAKDAGIKLLNVRSPITCMQAKGTCAKCHGLDETGQLPDVGENIGAKAGQTIAEPLVQLVMNCSVGNIVDNDGNATSFKDYYDGFDIEEKYDGHCYYKNIESKVFDGPVAVENPVIQNHAPDDDLIFIKTKNGNTLLVQANHPVWAYDKNGVPQEKYARDITKEDYFKISYDHLDGDLEPEIDGYLAGVYLAEGSTRIGNGTKKYEHTPVATIITQSELTKTSVAIKNRCMAALDGLNGQSRGPLDIQVYNPKFAAELHELVRGRNAWSKRLKPGFNKWSKQYLAKFVAGWIDGDGTVFNKNNTTVANIYTCSYVALQQLEIVCKKLGIKISSNVVSKRPLQKRVQFCAQLRFHDDLVKKFSVKLSEVNFFVTPIKLREPEYDRVTYIKKLWCWDEVVWDIKTSTRGFTCGMIRNHNTFHTGGAAGTGADVGGYKRIDQLLKLPKYVPNAASLSPVSGKVKKIEKGIAGGFDVTIGDHKIHVSQGRNMKVGIGDEVEIGDAVSDGVIKPQDLVKYKGMQPAQEYIVDELKKAYSGQGVNIDRKVFETVVRSFGNTTQVLNNPKGSGFVPGDIAPYTVVRNHNENLVQKIPLAEAEGEELAQTYGNLKAGTILGSKELAVLKASGYNEIEIKAEAIKHAPMLKSVTTLPILRRNWMSALGYRNLAKALTEGAGQAWETDLEDYHPIPAFAYGKTFGKGKDGKY